MRPGQTFQPASAPAHTLNPRDFPFHGVEKGYNITSFGAREAPGWRDSFKTLPDLGFDGKSGRARWPPRAGSPSGSGRSPRPCVFDGSCFQYEALLLQHFILCPHECVFATESAQTVVLKGGSLAELFTGVEENNEDDSCGMKTRPQWLPIKKNKRGIKSQDYLTTQAGKD